MQVEEIQLWLEANHPKFDMKGLIGIK